MFKIILFFGSLHQESNILGTVYSNVAPVVGTSFIISIPNIYMGSAIVTEAKFLISATKEESQSVLVSICNL
jgi:hypothetical protein